MITPKFSCTQDTDSVIVAMYCPSVRASEVELHVDETTLSVHVNPYFLRLHFSGSVLEDDTSSAVYDPGTGYLTVTLTKSIKGEEFRDLDLLAKLLAPPHPKIGQPTIEVLSSDSALNDESELVERTESLTLEQKEIIEAAHNDWRLPQSIPEPLPSLQISATRQYGFLDMHCGYFRHVTHTENEVNELGADAETCPVNERRTRRIAHEDAKWDEEHYMADFADDEYIKELIHWTHPHLVVGSVQLQYTDEENLTMLRLPRKEYIATPIQTHNLYLTLITLLFAYAYDSRTTQNDPTPESAWTVGMLIPAFSALDPPACAPLTSEFSAAELAATLTPSYRRALAFPLYRSFLLAEECRSDVSAFLSLGKRVITRCLLELKRILDGHDVYYVYSKIWVDDFCVWVQACASDDTLRDLGSLLRDVQMSKDMIGWDLQALEEAAFAALAQDADSDDESNDDVQHETRSLVGRIQ